MKAWVLNNINDIGLETVDVPAPGSGEVLVSVKAAGVCGSDIQRVYETGAHVHPLIIGHEFSGTVAELGVNTDKKWLGRRVGVYPLIPCGKCIPCQRKEYEMCRSYGYLGSRRNGGFAEYAVVPADNLVELPGQVSFEEAAMLEPMAVAVHAMRRVLFSASDTIAVCGLGTIGLLLLMFLLEAQKSGKNLFPQCAGKIFAIGNKDIQKQIAINMGLPKECYCDSRVQPAGEWIKERTNGEGVDVFFECVGKNETFAQAIENTAAAGRVVLTGNPYSNMQLKKGAYWKILRNQLTVSGTWNSSYTHTMEDDWNYVLERLSQKKVMPSELITHRYPIDELKRGLEIMHYKREEYVKIMITV